MQFLYPAFLAGAVAVAIPIALHFFRRQRTVDVPFSAVRLLHKSAVPDAARRRLSDRFLLAARVIALLLLAAAFARPYVARAASASPPLRIIAIDRSFSMTGRLPAALAAARRAVNEAAAGERVAVMAFDDLPEVIAAPGIAADALSALAGVEPSFGATRYGPVLARASELANGADGRLVLITDLQRAGQGGAPPLSSGLQLDIRDVGPPPDNLAIVSLRAHGTEVIASVRNTGREPRAGEVRIERDGQVTATSRYTASAGNVTDVVIPYRVPSSGALSASLDDPDGFAADNRRFLIVGDADRQMPLIVTSEAARSGFYLSRALAAQMPEEGGGAKQDVALSKAAAAVSARDLSPRGAVALLSTRGLTRSGREAIDAFVRDGGGVFIAASPDVEPRVLSAMFENGSGFLDANETETPGSLSVTDLRHPLFRPFATLAANLGQARFDRAWRVSPGGWTVRAEFTDGSPALLERRFGEGRMVLFTSDLDRRWNDFPVHPAFVPFVIEALRYVSAAHGGRPEYTVAGVPPGVPARPGIHTAPGGGLVAVNVDERESDTAAWTTEELSKMVLRTPGAPTRTAAVDARRTEAQQSGWRWGLVLMIGALVAESFIGRARL